jgi:protein-S-isoprenylcysteine O-methyltransferase Ste14
MKISYVQLAGGFAFIFFEFAIPLFLAAGTLAWVAGWVYVVLFMIFTITLSLWLVKANPGLLAERLTGIGKADQEVWDKVLYGVLTVLFLGWLALMALDAARFGWSHVPVWVQALGALVLVGSFYQFYVTFRENSFLSPAVRIQQERGQTVISTGPYHYVRHPMYAGILLFVPGSSLLLGSWFGVLGGIVVIAAVAWRAVREERTLRDELPGYDAYMAAVRYRLIPYVW